MYKAYDKLLQYSLNLIAKRRYTSSQLERKMKQFFERERNREKSIFFKNEIDHEKLKNEVLNRLTELNYLNDEQYAVDYMNSRSTFKPRGKFMLRNELLKKGVSKEIIEKAIIKVAPDELGMAKNLLETYVRKKNSLAPKKLRDKSFQYLASKGFNPDTIYKCIESHYNPNVK